MNKKTSRIIIEILSFFVLIIFDQFTKNLAVNYLKDTDGLPVIKGVLELYYLPNGNTGAAFGMLKGHQGLFLFIAIFVVAIIGYILYMIPVDRKYVFLSVLLVFIAAGGVGNMIDRLRQSFVVDFIYFSLINFPIFNVADIYVSVSTVILALYLVFFIKEDDYKHLENAVLRPFKKKDNS